MGIFNGPKNVTPALLAARAKLANGGKLVILGTNALPEGISCDQFKVIFEQCPQHVLAVTSKIPLSSQPVVKILKEWGVDYVEDLYEPELQMLNDKKLFEHAFFDNPNENDDLKNDKYIIKQLSDFISSELIENEEDINPADVEALSWPV